jgi:putative pyoverdin transport system ATP-binding/permease protein
MKKLKIVEFFNKEYDGPKKGIIVMACIGALSFAVVVYVINQAAEMAADVSTDAEIRFFFMFIVICALYVVCKQYTLTQTTIMAESVVRKVRIRLIDKLRRTELRSLESLGQGDIFARITQDTDLISLTASDVIYVFESILSALALFFYTAFISLTGFVFIVIFVIVLYTAFFFNYLKIQEKLNAARLKEADFFDALNDTLSGFKEIKINSRTNNALFADIETLSKETEALKTESESKIDNNVLLTFIFFEGLLAVVVFGVPLFSSAHSEVIIQLVAVMLFVFGMLNGISRGMPVVITTNVAVENLERLESKLDSFGACTEMTVPDISEDFRDITLDSVSFQYAGEEEETLFLTGPIDLSIRQGEVLFIVGGNGSGKSTLLKLLTGLYYPLAGGRILLDGQTVSKETYQAYRELFSIIFTDFHMFKKLYGLDAIDEHRVKHLLKEMDIHTKTDYVDGRFTNIDLSTGQRKRLAYITALLEDKPIYVFDEWAADQDPEYRRHFYERFLEDLKAMNKTIIAVTHDDRYFDRADRVIKMEEGKVVEVIK